MDGERDTYQSGGDDCKGSGNRSGMNFHFLLQQNADAAVRYARSRNSG